MSGDASPWDAWDRLIHDPEADPLQVLAAAGQYQRYLAAVEREAIRAARASGVTWEDIGTAMGLTKQAVWRRFRSDVHGLLQNPQAARRWINEGTVELRLGPWANER